MNISSIKPIKAMPSSRSGQAVLAALLCAFGAAAFALGIFVVDAQAQVGIQAGTNYLSNSSFEKDGNGDGIPNSWFGGYSITSADKRVCNQSYVGDCSFKMVGDTNYKYLGQCVDFNPDTTFAGDKFKLKIWIKGKAIDVGAGEAQVYITFYDTGGAGQLNYDTFSIPGGTSAWASHQVSEAALADYDQICIYLVFEADSGKVWFDKVSLVYVP